jgi:PadR family transcriptional regulator PadR
MRPPDSVELPQGTLHLLILRTIALEPLHGWAVSQRIQQITRDVVQIPQGSLYPALHRLERRGWIAASWDVSLNNRRAKYYRLTAAGKRQLDQETGDWQKLVTAVGRVLKTC